MRGFSRKMSGSVLRLVWLRLPLSLRRSLRRWLGDIDTGPLSMLLFRGLLLLLTPVRFSGAFPSLGLSPLSLGSLWSRFLRSCRGGVFLGRSLPCPPVHGELLSQRLVPPASVGASRRTMGWLTASRAGEGGLLRDRLMCAGWSVPCATLGRSGPHDRLGSCSLGAQPPCFGPELSCRVCLPSFRGLGDSGPSSLSPYRWRDEARAAECGEAPGGCWALSGSLSRFIAEAPPPPWL